VFGVGEFLLRNQHRASGVQLSGGNSDAARARIAAFPAILARMAQLVERVIRVPAAPPGRCGVVYGWRIVLGATRGPLPYGEMVVVKWNREGRRSSLGK
jgi:hypothetical protein